MRYSKKLLEHFRHPHNQGKIKNADGIGEVGNIKCGDIMKIYIKVGKTSEKAETIKDIKFETLGCAAAIAASSALTDLAKGKTFEGALAITKDDIVKELGGDVPPIKYHCSILAEEGLKKAIKDYQSKQGF
ncbi:iron-sulfur cluster assembly scaffold protein [Candidatus Falkowbacteria bacterium]|nr:iron-sulfur cluster assembly scaffold protein [Candidatus Falkowbacteria bacterium]